MIAGPSYKRRMAVKNMRIKHTVQKILKMCVAYSKSVNARKKYIYVLVCTVNKNYS